MNELVPKSAGRSIGSTAGNIVVPVVIADAGEHAVRRFLELFAAQIRNKNTRMAYYRAVCHFSCGLADHTLPRRFSRIASFTAASF